MTDNILKYLNLLIDGKGYAGKISAFTPPVPTLTVEEYRAGGMPAGIDIATGFEKLTASGTLFGYEKDVLALWGVTKGSAVTWTARGSLEDTDGTVKPIAHFMRGTLISLDMGELGPNKKSELKFNLSLRYYRLEHSGDVVHELEPAAMKMIVGGVDQLAEHRDAIQF